MGILVVSAWLTHNVPQINNFVLVVNAKQIQLDQPVHHLQNVVPMVKICFVLITFVPMLLVNSAQFVSIMILVDLHWYVHRMVQVYQSAPSKKLQTS